MQAIFHQALEAAIMREFPGIDMLALRRVIQSEVGNTVWQGYGAKEIRMELLELSDFCWDRSSDWAREHPAFVTWANLLGWIPEQFVTAELLAPFLPFSQDGLDAILTEMHREFERDRQRGVGTVSTSIRDAIHWEMSEDIEQYVMSAIDRYMMVFEIRVIIKDILEGEKIVHTFTELLAHVRNRLCVRLNEADYHKTGRFFWHPGTPVAHVAMEHRRAEWKIGETPNNEPPNLFTLAVEHLLKEGRIIGKMHELGVNHLVWVPEQLPSEVTGGLV